jgi:N-acetylglutamate synthase-like GNAT family acetyltransferase
MLVKENSMISFKLAKAEVDDVGAIADIAVTNLREINAKQHSTSVMDMAYGECSEEALRSQLNWKTIFVAKNDGQILGTAALANFGNEDSPRWCLSNVFVKMELHGKGIGLALVEKVIECAKENGAGKIEVPSSRNSISFYEKCGFGDVQDENEDELTWMTMELSKSDK